MKRILSLSQYVAAILFCVLLREKVHAEQQILFVFMGSYNNPLGLAYRTDVDGGPYCCCDEASCSSDLLSAPSDCPVDACDLIFSVCLNATGPFTSPTRLTGDCTQTAFQVNSPNSFNFSSGLGSTFPSAFNSALLTFVLGSSVSYQDVTLTVAIHDFRSGQDWNLVDLMEISFQGRPISGPTLTYDGMFGIASITFSYTFFNTDDDLNITDIETSATIFFSSTQPVTGEATSLPVGRTATNVLDVTSAAIETSFLPAGVAFTDVLDITNAAMETASLPVSRAATNVVDVTNVAIETSSLPVTRAATNILGVTTEPRETASPLSTGVQNASAAFWFPLALATLAIAAAVLLGIVIVILVAMAVIKRRKRRQESFEISTNGKQLTDNIYLEVDNAVYIPSAELEMDQCEKTDLEKELFEKAESEFSTNTMEPDNELQFKVPLDNNNKEFYNYYEKHV